MVEKQASSEIAESRARFEVFFNRQELGHPLISNVRKTACWETYQQAERDTRERCAQLAEKEAILEATYEDEFERGWERACKAVAERIRGKE